MPHPQPLRYWRVRAGLSQQALAELVGVDPTLVAHTEQGRRRPHPRNRRKIAEALSKVLGQPVDVADVSEFAGDLPAGGGD